MVFSSLQKEFFCYNWDRSQARGVTHHGLGSVCFLPKHNHEGLCPNEGLCPSSSYCGQLPCLPSTSIGGLTAVGPYFCARMKACAWVVVIEADCHVSPQHQLGGLTAIGPYFSFFTLLKTKEKWIPVYAECLGASPEKHWINTDNTCIWVQIN